MKLSISTLGCPGKDLDEVLALLKTADVHGLEVRGIGGELNAEKITCFLPENREETLAKLRANNISLVCLDTSVSLHDASKYEKNVEECLAAIRLCREVGFPAIRVFGNDLSDGEGREEELATIKKLGLLLCDAARDAGVEVWLEIHGTINTVENLAAVLDVLGPHPAFGIIWDIMHTDRAYGDKWDPVYRLIRPFIRHVHIKDHLRDSTPPFARVLLGHGHIPIDDIVHRLEKDGYRGYYSLEWEKLWNPQIEEPEIAFPQFAEYMKRFR